jgi:CHASE2 domain-containing sensor protein
VIVGIRGFSSGAPTVLPALQSVTAGKDSLTGSLCIGNRLGYAFYAPLAIDANRRSRHERPAVNPALGLMAVHPGKLEAIDEERGEIRIRDSTTHDDQGPLASDGKPAAAATVAMLLLRLAPNGYWHEPARRISYANVLDSAPGAVLPPLAGKIALVGVTLRDEDKHDVVRGWTTERVYGMELHADTIANLSRGIAVRPLGPTAQWVLMLALAAAGAALSFVLFDRPRWQCRLVLAALLVVYAAAGVACYLAFDILLNTLYDISAFALAYAWISRLQRKAPGVLAEGSS